MRIEYASKANTGNNTGNSWVLTLYCCWHGTFLYSAWYIIVNCQFGQSWIIFFDTMRHPPVRTVASVGHGCNIFVEGNAPVGWWLMTEDGRSLVLGCMESACQFVLFDVELDRLVTFAWWWPSIGKFGDWWLADWLNLICCNVTNEEAVQLKRYFLFYYVDKIVTRVVYLS